MDMTCDTPDKEDNVETLPLFADMNNRTPRYTFNHPTGLLFATQFSQIALVVTEKAAFEDMRSQGFVQKGYAFAGHSLGEYSALASNADVLHISALVDVVFYRGPTMQCAVERDFQNSSNYAMCVVNPFRVPRHIYSYSCTKPIFYFTCKHTYTIRSSRRSLYHFDLCSSHSGHFIDSASSCKQGRLQRAWDCHNRQECLRQCQVNRPDCRHHLNMHLRLSLMDQPQGLFRS